MDDETLNLHVTALTMFEDGKLQDIHRQTLLDPQLVKLARVIQNGWAGMQIYMHSGYIGSTCTSPITSL